LHSCALPCSACEALDRALWSEWLGALGLITGGSPNYDDLAKCKAGLPVDQAAACRVFRAAADAYAANRKASGNRPQFHFFAKDFTDWLAASGTGAGATRTRAMTRDEAIAEAERTGEPAFMRDQT
jgi:hypothetical protein